MSQVLLVELVVKGALAGIGKFAAAEKKAGHTPRLPTREDLRRTYAAMYPGR